QEELDKMLDEHVRRLKAQSRLSTFIQPLVLRLMSRRSIIMRGIMAVAGGYMSGLDTYLLKLGPENLGKGYASAIDRQIAGSLSGLSVRLRLQDVSQLLAEGLAPALTQDKKKTLHLLNIGGGPCIDSLNALLVIRNATPNLLMGRAIFVHGLDMDEAGPSFGKRALAALQADGSALEGLDITFQHVRYNWSEVSVLRGLLDSFDGSPIVAASSEGALFEYGSDEDITANLRVLREGMPANTTIAGSLTRADATGQLLNRASSAALYLRPLDAFTGLIEQAGWELDKIISRPISHNVRLKKK
ncbi:MAG: hypothetical protein ACXWNQ_08920, partial [Anaerolineales bacterium]